MNLFYFNMLTKKNAYLLYLQESYASTISAKYGDDISSHPSFDADAWVEATGGSKKGRLYGFGSTAKATSILGGPSASYSCTQPGILFQTHEQFEETLNKRMEERLEAKTAEIEARFAAQIPQLFEAWARSRGIEAPPSGQFSPSSCNGNNSATAD